MTTIVITDRRAIRVTEDGFELCKWVPTVSKKTGEPQGWTSYKYPSTMERCVEVLTREAVGNLDLIVTMKEFNEKWEEMSELIYKKIHEGEEATV